MRKIYVFAYTEYHLILFLNHYLINSDKYTYKLFLLSEKARRFKRSLDFSHLEIEIEELPIYLTIKDNLDEYHLKLLKNIENNVPDIILFFQENSLLSAIIVSKFSNKIEFWLFQDGMKPYGKINSLSIIKDKLLTFLWLIKHKFYPFVFNIFNPYSYGNLLGVKKLGLTHTEEYVNWSNCILEEIKFDRSRELNEIIKKVFNIKSEFLYEKQILYFNQPLNNFENINEFELINKIRLLNKLDKIYFKLHPFSSKEFIELCSQTSWIVVLDSSIPAEVFLLNSRNCIILSIYSTVLLFNTPFNSYFSLHKLLLDNNKFYNRKFDFSNIPSSSICIVENFEQVIFPGNF